MVLEVDGSAIAIQMKTSGLARGLLQWEDQSDLKVEV